MLKPQGWSSIKHKKNSPNSKDENCPNHKEEDLPPPQTEISKTQGWRLTNFKDKAPKPEYGDPPDDVEPQNPRTLTTLRTETLRMEMPQPKNGERNPLQDKDPPKLRMQTPSPSIPWRAITLRTSVAEVFTPAEPGVITLVW